MEKPLPVAIDKEIYRKGDMLTVELFGNSPLQSKVLSRKLCKRYGLDVISKKSAIFIKIQNWHFRKIWKPLKIKEGTRY
jgi:hypothetical protein